MPIGVFSPRGESHVIYDMEGVTSRWVCNDQVKKADWWTYKKGTKEGVSQKQRLRYLLYGSKKEYDLELLKSIDEHINNIHESVELLNKTAHGSDQPMLLIESTLKLIESIIFKIIKTRQIENHS